MNSSKEIETDPSESLRARRRAECIAGAAGLLASADRARAQHQTGREDSAAAAAGAPRHVVGLGNPLVPCPTLPQPPQRFLPRTCVECDATLPGETRDARARGSHVAMKVSMSYRVVQCDAIEKGYSTRLRTAHMSAMKVSTSKVVGLAEHVLLAYSCSSVLNRDCSSKP